MTWYIKVEMATEPQQFTAKLDAPGRDYLLRLAAKTGWNHQRAMAVALRLALGANRAVLTDVHEKYQRDRERD